MSNPRSEPRSHQSRPGDGGPDSDEHLVCRVYTHARRHPVVIGNIQGLRIPPVTPAQLLLGVGSLALLLMTQPLWGHMGSVMNSIVLFGVPLGLAFAVRAIRIEGRAPWRAGLGWMTLLFASRRGSRLGATPPTDPRMARGYRPRTWIAELGADIPLDPDADRVSEART
jgi:hypothetical protein